MFEEVAFADTFLTYGSIQFRHRLPLVVAREEHSFLPVALTSRILLAFPLEHEKAMNQSQ